MLWISACGLRIAIVFCGKGEPGSDKTSSVNSLAGGPPLCGLPLEEAGRHYQEAVALFPVAQSALLASSQVALRGANVPAASRPFSIWAEAEYIIRARLNGLLAV